jgi:hypothetical protein
MTTRLALPCSRRYFACLIGFAPYLTSRHRHLSLCRKSNFQGTHRSLLDRHIITDPLPERREIRHQPCCGRILFPCRRHRWFDLAPRPGPTKACKAKSTRRPTPRVPSPASVSENTASINIRANRCFAPSAMTRRFIEHRAPVNFDTI